MKRASGSHTWRYDQNEAARVDSVSEKNLGIFFVPGPLLSLHTRTYSQATAYLPYSSNANALGRPETEENRPYSNLDFTGRRGQGWP